MKLLSPLIWVEISKSALHHNIDSLSKLAGKSRLAFSVKANAYGHGLAEVISVLNEQNNVSYLTVHSLQEARNCRELGWKRRIMVLGPIATDMLAEAIELDIEPVVFTTEELSTLGRLGDKRGKTIKTHLKLETGTNRQGVNEKELPAFATIYKKHRSLRRPYGASMHFANIEDTTRHEFASEQLEKFKFLQKCLSDLRIKPTIRHVAASSGLILFKKTRLELVRPGISLYGLWPSKETFLTHKLQGGREKLLEPVLSWKTRITQTKNLSAGSYVGYGCSYRTTAPCRLAIIPVGYSDGYDRLLSNHAYVLVDGMRAPVRGRICMNLTMIDITLIRSAKLGSEVTLIGMDDPESLPCEQLASWSQTINYETVTRISASIPRILTTQ